MEKKVRGLLERLDVVEEELGSPQALSDQKRYKELTTEHSYLSQIREMFSKLESQRKALIENKELMKEESDPEMVEVIQEEIDSLNTSLPIVQKNLEMLLVPPDPNDNKNTILEIRAGTGGDEAAIFVGDCVRMFKLFADSNKWNVERLSCTESDRGGFKEYVMVLSGQNVHRLLQYEAGTHRVQRVPVTETQGRVHTSAVTMAVLLEPDEDEKITIDESQLKIDTYRASGAGGQHVNTTDSAVRITHMPSGIVVQCQEERSQHKNKDKAMRVLAAKLADHEKQKKEQEMSSIRSSQVGTGDRSERIRTYNFPQNRITDHRIDLTLYKLDQVMEGDLEEITGALVAHFYHEKLTT
jgi:peptide chain release factor 1